MEKEHRRLLIVDDEKTIAMVLAETLEKVDQECVIETASSGAEALSKIQDSPYTLVITDYKMPGIDGLSLIRQIRELSPETRVVLMTAYGNSELRDSVADIGLSEYLEKPFTLQQIRQIVKNAVGQTHLNQEDPYRTGERTLKEPVYDQLQALQSNAKARCVLLLSASGYPIDTAGHTNGLDISSVSALVAANFVAAAELAKLLGSGSIFKSSYHEGSDYNIYAYDLTGDLLLAVISESDSKPGMVWFYTKQTAADLTEILKEEEEAAAALVSPSYQENEEDLSVALDSELGKLFNEGVFSTDEGEGEAEMIGLNEQEETFANDEACGPLMNLEEAMAAGLAPSEWTDDDA